MLSIIFVKIIASIVNFTETEGWEERGIGTVGVSASQKEEEGRRWGKKCYTCRRSWLFWERTEFIVGAV